MIVLDSTLDECCIHCFFGHFFENIVLTISVKIYLYLFCEIMDCLVQLVNQLEVKRDWRCFDRMAVRKKWSPSITRRGCYNTDDTWLEANKHPRSLSRARWCHHVAVTVPKQKRHDPNSSWWVYPSTCSSSTLNSSWLKLVCRVAVPPWHLLLPQTLCFPCNFLVQC